MQLSRNKLPQPEPTAHPALRRLTDLREGEPGGDPRVYQVDGSEIALRAETASRLRIRPSRDAS
jgi:hypothetical protein